MRNLEMADAIREFVNTHKAMMAAFAVRFEEIYDKERRLAECNLSQADYDNLVRDAMRWRAEDNRMFDAAFNALQRLNAGRSVWNGPIHQAAAILLEATGPQKPGVVVDPKVFDMAHGLREILANTEFMAPPEPSVDGPNATDCNVFLGKPNHYKDGPKDP